MVNKNLKVGAWITDDSFAIAEIVKKLGYEFVVLDIEHGIFDLAALEKFVPFAKAIGLKVLSKVLVPERGPIQQALDFGSDGVIIPHIEDLEHAKYITSFTKFPPLGDRSLAGGRTFEYGGVDNEWVARQDKEILCFPMVEDHRALADIEKIMELDTVDGVFIGPTDLAIRRERGIYSRSEEEFADLKRVADAANANNKPWILPAWSLEEQQFALDNNAEYILLAMQHAAITEGYGNALKRFAELKK